MFLNDLHVYLVISLGLSLMILYKKFLVPFFDNTDQEIDDIKNGINNREERKVELQSKHELLVHELERENNNIETAVIDAYDVAKNIQIEAEKEIEAFATEKEKIYQSNVHKITNMAYVDLYNTIVESVIKNSLDGLNFSDDEHLSFNSRSIDQLREINIS